MESVKALVHEKKEEEIIPPNVSASGEVEDDVSGAPAATLTIGGAIEGGSGESDDCEWWTEIREQQIRHAGGSDEARDRDTTIPTPSGRADGRRLE